MLDASVRGRFFHLVLGPSDGRHPAFVRLVFESEYFATCRS